MRSLIWSHSWAEVFHLKAAYQLTTSFQRHGHDRCVASAQALLCHACSSHLRLKPTRGFYVAGGMSVSKKRVADLKKEIKDLPTLEARVRPLVLALEAIYDELSVSYCTLQYIIIMYIIYISPLQNKCLHSVDGVIADNLCLSPIASQVNSKGGVSLGWNRFGGPQKA